MRNGERGVGWWWFAVRPLSYALATMRLPIPGHLGYHADPSGTIYGKRGEPLAVRMYGRKKYPRVKVNGKPLRIHRLIASTFLPVAGRPQCVRHLNDDKLDNSAGNLAWGSMSDNMRDWHRNRKR